MAKSKFWLENLEPEFKNKFEKQKDNWILEDDCKKIDESLNKLNEANSNYKKNHNKVAYNLLIYLGLPLSFITIIPFYFAFKKFKQMYLNKKHYYSFVEEAQKNKTSLVKEITQKINFKNVFDSFKDIIDFELKGYINQSVIETLKLNSLFDYNENTNTYDSSWCVLNDKIIINKSEQEIIETTKTYVGYEKVSWIENGKTVYDSIRAEYVAPYYEINNNTKNYMFTRSCEELEFNFVEKSGSMSAKSFNKKNQYSPLENEEFNNHYKWTRNNEHQFRMFFTPLAQELYVKENDDSKKVENAFRWRKIKSFITTDENTKSKDFDLLATWTNLDKSKANFSSNAEDIKNEIYSNVLNYYYKVYLTFNYNWFCTLLQSENQRDIVSKIKNTRFSNNNALEANLFFNYILTSVLKEKALYSENIDTFHKITNTWIEPNKKGDIYCANFLGTSFKIYKETTYVLGYSSDLSRTYNVPVEYDYFEKIDASINIFVAYTDKPYYYDSDFKEFTNIEESKIEQINNIASTFRKVVIKDNLICVSTKYETAISAMKDLVDLINE